MFISWETYPAYYSPGLGRGRLGDFGQEVSVCPLRLFGMGELIGTKRGDPTLYCPGRDGRHALGSSGQTRHVVTQPQPATTPHRHVLWQNVEIRRALFGRDKVHSASTQASQHIHFSNRPPQPYCITSVVPYRNYSIFLLHLPSL